MMRPACAATVSRAISSAALLAAFLTATAVKSGNLGPGSKPWVPEPAGAHGLDPAKLTAAWDQLHAHASLDRKCLVVIKDGALVFEGYANDRGFNASSVHDGWSMTKTLGALLAGWATGGADGARLDLDADITKAYGVRSPKPYPTTARELMSQAIKGNVGPGQAWAYDSAGNNWVNRLTKVFAAATKRTPGEVWESEFRKPLGLSPGFSWPNADSVWAFGSAGTCRDYARVGQLLLNAGRWPLDADTGTGTGTGNATVQLLPGSFVSALGAPATRFQPYANYSNRCYGLLTWLNPEPGSSYPGGCRVPGKSYIIPQSSPIAATSLWPAGIPKDSFFAGGANGQITLVMPELNTVAVTMGDSTDPLDHGNHDYTAACLARALCPALVRNGTGCQM